MSHQGLSLKHLPTFPAFLALHWSLLPVMAHMEYTLFDAGKLACVHNILNNIYRQTRHPNIILFHVSNAI